MVCPLIDRSDGDPTGFDIAKPPVPKHRPAMKNPAPVVLSLLLAIVVVVLIVRRPDGSPEPPTNPSGEAAAPAGSSPPPSLSDAEPHPWPQEGSDLKPDPAIVFGTLSNGMRYIIQPNGEPPQRLSIRLHIAAGSLMERDDQLGLAHFLEHMVFNGSEHFTPDELVPRMQRLGIAFGAHVNAYTSFDETVYMLDLPDLTDPMIDLGFTVMRDFADGALLGTDEIDKERGVILAEKTQRDSVGYRLMQKQFGTLMPDSLVTKRFPIGDEEVIRNAPRERFVDFYQHFYVPRRMTFVAVGDIDPGSLETRIRETFGDMANPEAPGKDPDLGSVSRTEGVETHVFADKEVSTTELGFLSIEPFESVPDSRKQRADQLTLGLAHSMLGTRFDRLAKKEGAPILGGSASRSDLFRHATLGSVDVTVADDRWQDAVPVLEQEFRRALEHGFTAAEFAEARANTLNRYQQAVESKASRRSDGIATGIARSLNEGRVLTSPESDLELVSTVLDGLKPEDCHAAFRTFWDGKGLDLILTTKQEPENARGKLAELMVESRGKPVEPPQEQELKVCAHSEFGAAGEVASRDEIEGLDITRLVLSNGVTVHFKPTEFEKNRIRLQARVGFGKLTAPTDKPGLSDFATAVVNDGGIGGHSAEELQQIFAGRNVGAGFSVEDDHFAISGTTTPDDLKLQLQLMTAQLLLPGYRAEAIDQFRKSVPMIYQQLRHTAAGPMQDMSAWLRGDDPRFVFPKSPDVLLGYGADDLGGWLASEFTAAPLELNVIGDFDPEVLVPLILKTFGAIDPRPAEGETRELDRGVAFPEPPQTRTFGFESKIPTGEAVVVWKAPGPRGNQRQFRRLQLLADVLGDRLREKIREELGASYSPNAGVGGSNALDDFGFLYCMSSGTPDSIEQLNAVSVDLAATLADEGATEDELGRARNPVLADIQKSLRDNSYWLDNVMSGSTADPERFALARDRQQDVESITLDDINGLATEYLGKGGALRILIRPTAPIEE
jgi:zinc protease